MPIATLTNLDHVVIVVRDLDAGRDRWRDLGFTVSDRGLHSAVQGTANHTMMLAGGDYLELLGVVAPTERNAPMRALLEKREGIERAGFRSTDAAAGVAAVKASGIPDVMGPLAFSRPVTPKNGPATEARFDTFHWPLTEKPGGLRIFACQHHTPDAVWLPELLTHRNGATAIRHLDVIDDDPKAAAEHLSRLLALPVASPGDGIWEVDPGGNMGRIRFLTRASLARRHPGVPLDHLPERGGAALSLTCQSIEKARAVLGPRAIRTGDNALVVPPSAANGALIEFVGA